MVRRPRFRWRSFALAALAMFAGHWLAIPRMFLPLLERPERPMEIAFVDDEGMAPILEKEDSPSPPSKDLEKKPEPKVEQEKEKKEKEKEKEKLVVTPPPPTPPPPPPPQMEKQIHQK